MFHLLFPRVVVAFLLLAFVSISASGQEEEEEWSSVGSGDQVSNRYSSEEDWKGESYDHLMNAGIVTGLGIYDAYAGLALLGNFGFVVLREGFVPDINDPLTAEVVAGPVFTVRGTAWLGGVHARWDFIKDVNWAFFALAGLGLSFAGEELGQSVRVFPRFGAGFFYRISSLVAIRAEVSHQWIVGGISFNF